MSKNKKPIIIEDLEIIDISDKGKSVAKYDGKTIFVDGAIPGDICDVRVFKKRRKYSNAKTIKIKSPSKHRIDPKCEHFGVCGGCKWQNMNYQAQLKFKENKVIENLKRISGAKLPNHDTIIESEDQYSYRNKMEFTFSNKRWLTEKEILGNCDIENKNGLGFHVSGFFDKVVDINQCHLESGISNKIRMSVKEYAKKNSMSYFDIRGHNGLLRNLIIRTSLKDEIMVIVQFYEDNMKEIELLMNHLKDSFSEITSLLYVINKKANNTLYDQEVITFSGRDYINEKIDGLEFKITAKSFFQTNSKQTKVLYKKIKELSGISRNDIVYDLYTGTGTIAQYISSLAKKVVGIDSVGEAIESAKENTKNNNINNCDFFSGDMKDIFSQEFIQNNGIPNIVITDPPRDGMHKKVVSQLLNIMPKKIIYVSCNSATQARDIAILKDGYDIQHIQPVDMFPQTHHVENIVVLTRNNS